MLVTPPTPFPTVSAVPPRTPSEKDQRGFERKASEKEALLPTLSMLIEWFWMNAAVMVSVTITLKKEMKMSSTLVEVFCKMVGILMDSIFLVVAILI